MIMDQKTFLSLVKKEEDFIVKEILNRKFLSKFERSEKGVKKIEGPYTLFLLTKKGMTTEKALRIVSRKLKVPLKGIGYAGLKDKHAVTYQHLTVKDSRRELEGFEEGNMSLKIMGRTNRHIFIGDIEGNAFEMKLQKTGLCEKFLALDTIPNYFGFQRFGIEGKNPLIGKLLLQRNYDEALKIINEIYEKEFKDLTEIEKKKLKFFVHAYQSYLFNEVLDEYTKKGQNIKEWIAIPGAKTKAGSEGRKLLSADRIAEEGFSFPDLKFRCDGTNREAFANVKDRKCEEKDGITELRFFLPSGSYASVVLSEVVDDKEKVN